MAPCNPSLVPRFQRLHSSEPSPNPLRLSTKNIPAAQRSFPSRGCVIRPCYLRGPAFIPAERSVRTRKAGGQHGVPDPGPDPWQVIPHQVPCHPGHCSPMCLLCSVSSSPWVRGNPHLPGSFRALRDTSATPRQAQQVPELSRFPGRCHPPTEHPHPLLGASRAARGVVPVQQVGAAEAFGGGSEGIAALPGASGGCFGGDADSPSPQLVRCPAPLPPSAPRGRHLPGSRRLRLCAPGPDMQLLSPARDGMGPGRAQRGAAAPPAAGRRSPMPCAAGRCSARRGAVPATPAPGHRGGGAYRLLPPGAPARGCGSAAEGALLPREGPHAGCVAPVGNRVPVHGSRSSRRVSAFRDTLKVPMQGPWSPGWVPAEGSPRAIPGRALCPQCLAAGAAGALPRVAGVGRVPCAWPGSTIAIHAVFFFCFFSLNAQLTRPHRRDDSMLCGWAMGSLPSSPPAFQDPDPPAEPTLGCFLPRSALHSRAAPWQRSGLGCSPPSCISAG